MLCKILLMAKKEIGTLYFSMKAQFTIPPIAACKNQKIVNLSLHATLSAVSALCCKNLLYHQVYGVQPAEMMLAEASSLCPVVGQC